MLEPPLADEGLAAQRDLLARRRVDHVVVIGGDLVMQALGRMRQQVAVLVHGGVVEEVACTSLYATISPCHGLTVKAGTPVRSEDPEIGSWRRSSAGEAQGERPPAA